MQKELMPVNQNIIVDFGGKKEAARRQLEIRGHCLGCFLGLTDCNDFARSSRENCKSLNMG